MDEPRKIVLVLGNGFDLDFGLKTSFKDFWESSYCPKDYPAPLIKYLNERWGDNLNMVRWYDLENELMEYYRKICCKNVDFDVITHREQLAIKEVDFSKLGFYFPKEYYTELCSLKSKGYLINTSIGYTVPLKDDLLKAPEVRDKEAFDRIKEGLCNYIKSINTDTVNYYSTAATVLTAVMEAKENNSFINIYSFNYTGTINENDSRFIDVFHYVHGSCNSGIIIVGTQDSENYDKRYDFLQKSFDPCFYPPALVPDLLDADDVIIFGHSLGENDRQYFKAFFKQQSNYDKTKGKRITLFTRDANSELDLKRALQKMTDSNLSALCSRNKVQFFKTVSLKNTPKEFKDFLSLYISDNQLLWVIMNQFLRDP